MPAAGQFQTPKLPRQRRRPRNPLGTIRQVPEAQVRRQRAKRRSAALDRSPLLDPSVQLSGANLHNAAVGLANIETRPQLKAIGLEIASTRKQGGQLAKNTTDYYRGLAAEEAKSVDRQRAIADRTNQALKGIADETGRANEAAAGEVSGILDQDQAQRGAGLDGGARERLAAELAARQGVASGSAAAFRSAGVLQGAGAESLSAATRRAGMLRGGETQQEISRRTANTLGNLNAKANDLRSSRGQLATKYLTNLRQTGFENLATVRGLGIKQAEIASDAAEAQLQASLARRRLQSADRHNRQLERLSARGQDVTARGQDISSADRRQAERGRNRRDRRGARQRSATERRRSQEGLTRIYEALDVYRRVGDMSTAARRLRRLDNPMHPEVINAAAGLYERGYISRNTIQALRQMGVDVPRKWQPPHRRRR
jgi:hypothetical protein